MLHKHCHYDLKCTPNLAAFKVEVPKLLFSYAFVFQASLLRLPLILFHFFYINANLLYIDLTLVVTEISLLTVYL